MLEIYRDDIHYPSSDNEPMGENDVICWLMTASLDAMKRHFSADENVYVSSNSFIYYVKDDPLQRVAPDLYVVKGVSSKKRPNYKIWEEGVVPQVVFEFTTESSRYKDLGVKKGLYEALGVKEYYLFDPVSEYLEPHFRAFRLEDGALHELPHKNSHFSPELQLTIRPQGQLLRFYPVDSLKPVPTSDELADLADQEAERAEQEAARAEQEAARAEQEAARAEQALQQSAIDRELLEKEVERSRELEDEVARLRRALERNGA
jgi:Uma2 family endonuclease